MADKTQGDASANQDATQDQAANDPAAVAAQVTAERDALTATLAERDAQVAALEGELASVTAERDAASAALAERDTRVAALESELATMTAERDTAVAAAAEPVETPPPPRACGPIDGTPLALDALRAAIADGDDVQVVFSDGAKEVGGLVPLRITGSAWLTTVPGLKLQVPALVITPTDPVEIAGYGLFIDGEQVAWAPRPDVLRLAAGQQSDIANDVVFPG